MDNLLDTQDLADIFKVSKERIYKWTCENKGFPKPVKRRWRESVIENYIKSEEKRKLEEANRK